MIDESMIEIIGGILAQGRLGARVLGELPSTSSNPFYFFAYITAAGVLSSAVAELTVPVVHCLLALPGTSLAGVRYVGSHPTALAQCRNLFATRRTLQPCVAHDTAGAARELAALGGRGALAPTRAGVPAWFEPYRPIHESALAVIAGASVARLYGLTVMVDGVQDNAANATRFVVVKAQDGVRW